MEDTGCEVICGTPQRPSRLRDWWRWRGWWWQAVSWDLTPRKRWMDNIKEWTWLPMPELLTRASCRNDWKRISAESSLMSRLIGQGNELNWTEHPVNQKATARRNTVYQSQESLIHCSCHTPFYHRRGLGGNDSLRNQKEKKWNRDDCQRYGKKRGWKHTKV